MLGKVCHEQSHGKGENIRDFVPENRLLESTNVWEQSTPTEPSA